MAFDYSRIYNAAMKTHALLPHAFADGYAFAPMRISMMLTYKCNLGCYMCFQDEWRKQHRGSGNELSFQEIAQVIDQTSRTTLLTLAGGEPFVRPDMVEILRYASRRNPCNILTNGTLLDETAVEAIVESGIKLVGISIDGIEDVHDSIRARPNCFQKTLAGVRRLQDCKTRHGKRLPLIDIKTMILPGNVDQLGQVLDLALDLQADFFTLALPFGDLPFSPYARQDLSEIMKPVTIREDLDVDLLVRELRSIRDRRPPIHLRFYPSVGIDEVIRYYTNEIDSSNYKPCTFPWSHLWISPTGQVFPCLSYEIGNVRDHSLKQLYNNSRFRAFRRAIKHLGVAPSCVGCCYMVQKERSA